MSKCRHCKEQIDSECDHRSLCCDCFDLSWGMPLDALNKERADKGKPPITRPWGAE